MIKIVLQVSPNFCAWNLFLYSYEDYCKNQDLKILKIGQDTHIFRNDDFSKSQCLKDV